MKGSTFVGICTALACLGAGIFIASVMTGCSQEELAAERELTPGEAARVGVPDAMIACYSGGVEILLDYPKGGVSFLSDGAAHYTSALTGEKVIIHADCIYRARP